MTLTRRRMAKGKKILAGQRTTIEAFLALIAVPTVITMFLAGIWHGAGNQYLIMGILFGGYIAINHAWRMFRPRFWKNGPSHDRVMGLVYGPLTLICVAIALVFFHAQTVPAALDLVAGMADLHGAALPAIIDVRFPALGSALARIGVEFTGGGLHELLTTIVWIAVLLLVVLGSPNVLEILRDHDPAITDTAPSALGRAPSFVRSLDRSLIWQPTVRWAAVTGLLMAFGVLAMNRITPFLYWQF